MPPGETFPASKSCSFPVAESALPKARRRGGREEGLSSFSFFSQKKAKAFSREKEGTFPCKLPSAAPHGGLVWSRGSPRITRRGRGKRQDARCHHLFLFLFSSLLLRLFSKAPRLRCSIASHLFSFSSFFSLSFPLPCPFFFLFLFSSPPRVHVHIEMVKPPAPPPPPTALCATYMCIHGGIFGGEKGMKNPRKNDGVAPLSSIFCAAMDTETMRKKGGSLRRKRGEKGFLKRKARCLMCRHGN